MAHPWSESHDRIYPTLKALESEGLVAGRGDEDEGRSRRVYRLTDSGLDTLRAWLAEPPETDVPDYEMSLKLFFADQLPPAATLPACRRAGPGIPRRRRSRGGREARPRLPGS